MTTNTNKKAFRDCDTEGLQTDTNGSYFGTNHPPCATVCFGAEHTTKLARNLRDSEVFSRPNTSVLGLGAVNRKATGATNFACSNPVPPYGLNSHRAGFQSQLGAKTMTTVNTPTTPKTGTTPAGNIPRYSTPATLHLDRLALIQRADNALSMARWHLRKQSTPEVIRLATGKAVSAARALKQACAEGGAL
jgi:hypothetical protein